MVSVNKKQKGFVSIFIVIFTAILIAVITISFVRIMLKDQQQAVTNDLSRSAYDSAQAGVEDAKRALLDYVVACNGSDTTACLTAQEKINSSKCNVAVNNADSSEVTIKTGDSDTLDQAYTCVKVKLDTESYLGSLLADGYKTIPLSAVSSFDTIKIEWFNSNNVATNSVNLLSGYTTPLLRTWGQTQNSTTGSPFSLAASDRPPIMRAQVIQIDKKNGFSLGDFDSKINGSGANTLFLYPNALQTSDTKSITAFDLRRTPTGSPQLVPCSNNLSTTTYSCKMQITLPAAVSPTDQMVFLNLSALYNRTDYQITLLSGATVVKFNAVQPEIDSTGRANDLFRRVKTRIELTDVNFPYPEAAVDITGSFCKDFSITDNAGDYNRGRFDADKGTCGN